MARDAVIDLSRETPDPVDCDTNAVCCRKCAVHPHSQERSDPYGWMFLQEAWDDGVAFFCHESVPGHPQEIADDRPRWRLCAGWAAHQERALGRHDTTGQEIAKEAEGER